jgi:DNA helicase-2/ATP-dependent DNA helicase PcrA
VSVVMARVVCVSPDEILARLDPEQREVATSLRGAVRVVAGAGSGKTRAITHRIAHGVAAGIYEPQRVLALSFTVDAAGEMRTRLAQLGVQGVQTRTFHSAALRQLRYFWPRYFGGELPEVMGSKFQFVGRAARDLGLPTDQATVRDLASEIEWAKVSNVTTQDYPKTAARHDRSVGDIRPEDISALMATYEQSKREAGRIDMEDFLLLTAAMLDADERIAAEVRRQYQWFVVDEFQDVNPLQATLLDLWLGGRDNLCVVGDPRQTIFSFAGATPEIFGRFGRQYPDATRIELVRNYRSTPQIVARANELFPRDTVTLQSQNPPGPKVDFTGYSDEEAEASQVAAAIKRMKSEGIALKEIAILYRINAQSQAFEAALSEAAIPFVLKGTRGFFQRSEVRQAVTLLRGAARAADGHGDDVIAEVRSVLTTMNHSDTPPTATGDLRDRWESLNAITSLVVDLVREHPTTTLADVVTELDRRADAAHAPVASGVTLSTLHAAKGLEWDAVFLIGIHEGTLPFVHARTEAAVEEERRLLYVGFTRARKRLSVSWTKSRNAGGKGTRKPSRFIVPMLPFQPAETKSRQRKLPVDADPAVFEALRTWRKAQATAESVPAFVVFNDATLGAIAAHKPTSLDELMKVPGIGAVKREKYGESLLRVLGESR